MPGKPGGYLIRLGPVLALCFLLALCEGCLSSSCGLKVEDSGLLLVDLALLLELPGLQIQLTGLNL